jgi:hypothetical protein
VRIYSRALSRAEIAEEVERAANDAGTAPNLALSTSGDQTISDDTCAPNRSSNSFKDRVAGPVVTLAMLVAIVCATAWSSKSWRVVAIILSGLSGLALLPALGPIVPGYFRVVIPLLALAGGWSVVRSVRERP